MRKRGGGGGEVSKSHPVQALAVSPRKGDGRISGDARRQPVTTEQRQFSEAPFNAFVNISQTFFESENLLTHDRKTKMARLDDSRLDGNHRDFIHTVALHRYA